MVDITYKIKTLRTAIAQAIVKVSHKETIKAISEKRVPKGDVFEMAKTAGLFAVKRTGDMIPGCHPIPIEFTSVGYDISGLEIRIKVEVRTIAKTGVEVEAMHGASVVAMTIYDMLKPIDKQIEITSIKLLEKSGGKSSFTTDYPEGLKAAIIVCSDSISAGKKKDKSGKIIMEKLLKHRIFEPEYIIVPDEKDAIAKCVLQLCKKKADIIILTGGTGLSPRDVTPEAIRPLLDREIPGIMEAARQYGMERMPYSMLSRSIAGIKGETIILALPGSVSGAVDYMDALFPYILHTFKIIKGASHDVQG
ncbi:MAG: bifunctional molybdenum cofactor biosynthesis protein MoaC/MoaB [Bacteroidia bacterium]